MTEKSAKKNILENKIEPEISKKDIDKLIRNHVIGSMGVGLIPFPWLDFLGLTGVQINLVRKLANIYDIPFFQDKVKNLISSLVGSALPSSIGTPFASLVKTIPLAGQSLGIITMPILSGASTYALGKVFVRHFAAGGTFLTLDPDKVKDYYAEMFKEGKLLSVNVKKND